MGGGLVSLVHLTALNPDSTVYTFSNSTYLRTENINHEVLVDSRTIEGDTIWINDTCGDDGYNPDWWTDLTASSSRRFLNFLEHHLYVKEVFIVNHQPINRCHDWLIKVLHALAGHGSKIYLMNYRANWNNEFEFYCRPSLRHANITCMTLPYFYSPDLMRLDLSSNKKDISFTSVGRLKSKSKISYYYSKTDILGHSTIEPNSSTSLMDVLTELSHSNMVLTGYYWDHAGNKESDVPFNKLEWSYLDSLMAGSIPITSTLFKSELNRLGFDDMPLFEYEGPTDEQIISLLWKFDSSALKEYTNDLTDSVKKEIDHGNSVMKTLLQN